MDPSASPGHDPTDVERLRRSIAFAKQMFRTFRDNGWDPRFWLARLRQLAGQLRSAKTEARRRQDDNRG